MVFDLLAFVTGIIYGYINPGKEKKGELLKKGFKIGLGLGIFFAFLNLITGGFLKFGATLIGTIIGVIYLTLAFIVGTIIGDFFERKIKKD